jgi:hypothetical protein
MIKEYGGLNSTRKGKGGAKSLGKGDKLNKYAITSSHGFLHHFF